MLLETFIIVMVMMSLCFYILFAVQQIQTGSSRTASPSSYSGIIMYTYIFTPYAFGIFVYLGAQHAAENADG